MNDQGTPAKKKGAQRQREPRTKRVFSYPVATKVRAAFLAGQGKTPRQIADATGISTPDKARGLLRSLDILLPPEVRGTETVVVRLTHGAVDAMAVMADRAGMDPATFAARVLTMMVVEEAEVLRNLLDRDS